MYATLQQGAVVTRAIKGGKRPPKGFINPLKAPESRVSKEHERDKSVKELMKTSSKSNAGRLLNPSSLRPIDSDAAKAAHFITDIPGLSLPTFRDIFAPYMLGTFYVFKNDCLLQSIYVNSNGDLCSGMKPTPESIISMREIYLSSRASPTPVIISINRNSFNDYCSAQSFIKTSSSSRHIQKPHESTWSYKTQTNLVFRQPEPLLGVGYPCLANLSHCLSLPRDRFWTLLSGNLEFLALEQAVESRNQGPDIPLNSIFLPALFVDDSIPPIML